MSSEDSDTREPDVQTLYSKVKKLLLTYPPSPRWSSSYETINGLELKSETSYGVINQYYILLNQQIFAKCRLNLDDQSIITDLDYTRSLKPSLNKEYDESLLFISSNKNANGETDANNNDRQTNINKYVLQNLIHTLQHSDIVPYHKQPKRVLRVTKCVGISTSEAHKFNDREYFWDNDNRRIIQIQVCFDKHVHGLQVKWAVNNSNNNNYDIYSGSQHFSSRFSGKNIDTLVLAHHEYICCVTGSCSQWIDSLIIHTNFGRIKTFGSTNKGQPFDLEIPENCQVVGFCGSYSSQLYTLGALYTPIIKKESKEIMIKHINKRIIKIRQISLKLQNLFADIDKKCNSDVSLLKYLRSNHQSSDKKRKSYKTSSIRNTWMMEILKVLVKSAAKNDPSVVPQILNILALILEDNTSNIFNTNANNKSVSSLSIQHRNNKHRHEQTQRSSPNEEKTDAQSEDPYSDVIDFMKSISVNDGQLIDNQCIRVMISIAIARGSLFDILSIVKMLLDQKSNHHNRKIYNVFKILLKLHTDIGRMHSGSEPFNHEFHPLQSIIKYAPYLHESQAKTNNANDSSDEEICDDLCDRNHSKLSGLELCVILLSELELIAINQQNHKNWKLNRESLSSPLHIDCSFKVLRILNEILLSAITQLKSNKTSTELNDIICRIVYHSLKLLTVQVSAIDKLRITIDNFCIPNYRIKELKSILLKIMRFIPDLPQSLIEAAANTLVKGQKLFFNTVNTKLIYLLALLIRQQEIEQNSTDNNTYNTKLKNFLEDFSDDLVDNLSSITSIEIANTLPVMLEQFGSVGSPSQFIDSLLSTKEEQKEEDQSRKLFFGTLEMLVSNCWIDIKNLYTSHNERMAQLLLDLQSMLLFRYQSQFEYGSKIMYEFSDQIPIYLQESWYKMYENPLEFNFETKEQQNIDECLFQYAKHVICISTQILQDINNSNNDERNTNELSFFFENNCEVLHKSFFGKITIPLLTNLLGLIESTTKDTQKQKIFKHLMKNKLFSNLLTPHISDLLKLTDTILTKSNNYCVSKLRKECKSVQEIRESPHPYPSGKTIKKLVTIPGAKELIVTFDKTVCCTCSEKDYLQLFTKTCNGFVSVTSPIYGSSNKWPNKIIIPGDCVLIHFTSLNSGPNIEDDLHNEPAKAEYGFKLTVESQILVNHMQKLRWLEDLSCLMVKFHTTVASSFIDPGHLGVSFAPLTSFPLLFIGGHNTENKNNQLHSYLHQIESWIKLNQKWENKDDYEKLLWNIHDFKECKENEDIDNFVNDSGNEHKTQTEDSNTIAFNSAMSQLFICTPPSSILLFEETQTTKDCIAQLHCSIYAVLLRHTGSVAKFSEYLSTLKQKQKQSQYLNVSTNSRAQSMNMIPREVQVLWERARVGVNHILSEIQNEQELIEKKKYFILRSKLLMKIAPAFLHIEEVTGDKWDTAKLIKNPEGYSSPLVVRKPWICNICFHFNDSSQLYCQICESEQHKNKIQGINKRFTWSKKNFPSEDLFHSFQSVCCVENIIRSQRHTNHHQNYVKVSPIKKLVKQVIIFITENKTEISVFNKLLSIQSTLGLFRIKGLQIIYENIINLKYPSNIAQFAEHLSNLLTLSNVQSMAMTQRLNLTESKQIEKSVANLKLSSIHSGGFAHILSNVECCGYSITSEILSLMHNIIKFLSQQSQQCDNHQLGFTTPFLHLMGTLIRSQDLQFISCSDIIPHLADCFSLQSINTNNSTNISFQQRFAAWTAFRTLTYSTSFPMYSPLPTNMVNEPNTLSADKTEKARLQVLSSIVKIIRTELKTLFETQQSHRTSEIQKDDLKEILLKLHNRPASLSITKNKNNHSNTMNSGALNKKTKWSCDICTYMNGVDDDTCRMCFRGVRPMYNHNNNECHGIDIAILCLNCGAEMGPQNKRCMQCREMNENTSPLPCMYNEKLQILKWCDRSRKQSICNVDIQWLYLLQKEIGWISNVSNVSRLSNLSQVISPVSSYSVSLASSETATQTPTPILSPKQVFNENDATVIGELIENEFDSAFIKRNPTSASKVHPLSLSFGINQLLWLLLRCCPCPQFLALLQQNNEMTNLLLDIIANKSTISNVSAISKILAIKILVWILPTLSPQNLKIEYNTFFEHIFAQIGDNDYYLWNKLVECPSEKEQNRIQNNICLELLYLIRVLFQNSNWTAIIENICFRILSMPFNKCDDVTMDSPTPRSRLSVPISASASKAASNKSSPICSDHEIGADDDEKIELEQICELQLIEEPYGTPTRSSFTKMKLSFEPKEDEKESKTQTSVTPMNSTATISFNDLNSLGFRQTLNKIIGILCVMGEFMSPLHEGVRVKVRHRDKSFTGTIIKIKYTNCSDPTGEFTQTEILCDNGLNLSINMTNKEQFKISLLDTVSFNPLKLSRPKYLLLLLRSYIHETFISPQSCSETSFCKTILRRVISVIRQFSRYNEFALMIQHFGLIKDLVAVSLEPLQKYEDYFDSSVDDENVWKSMSKSKAMEKWKKNLKIGSIIDCQDRLTKWFESEIIQFDHVENKLLIHYCEWSSKWDEWLSLESERIAPWRTHTDGSFKNRGYNPFSNDEKYLMDIKLRNPSRNINILQKCILGLNKFHTCSVEDSAISVKDAKKRCEVNENADSESDNQSIEHRRHPQRTHTNKGIPCPNHAYLPSANQFDLLSDVIANESLKVEFNNSNISKKTSKNGGIVLHGTCNINHEFKPDPPPIDHIPENYEFRGATLFLSLTLPKEKNRFENLSSAMTSLFEWNIDKIATFNLRFSKRGFLIITDTFDSMQHSPITIQSKRQLMVMLSVTKNSYSIYTNCQSYQFSKAISISNPQLVQNAKMTLKMTKRRGNLDGIIIQKIALWRWVGLDFNSFSYLCQWKDIFIESLQHLNPSKQTLLFDKCYNTNGQSQLKSQTSSEPKVFLSPSASSLDTKDVHFAVVNIANNTNPLNQYSIIVHFRLSNEKLTTPICLLQIPDGLVLSMLERDESIFEMIDDTPKSTKYSKQTAKSGKKAAKSGTTSPNQEKKNSETLKSITIHENTNNKPNPDIPMIWIDKKNNIWVCDQQIQKKIPNGEEHIISLCVNLKKRQLSIIFNTEEIAKINLKLSVHSKFKWEKHFKSNQGWSLKSKLICGGSIYPINRYKTHPNNLIIQRISVKPKCCSLHESISLALTYFFKNDSLSDLMGHLGFNVEQIKHSKQWKSNNDKSEWLDTLTKMTQHTQSNSNFKKQNKRKYNVKIQFKKKLTHSGNAKQNQLKTMNNNNNNQKTTKNYVHICAATQLDLISPEEIRWKTYKKAISMHMGAENSNNKTEYKTDDIDDSTGNTTHKSYDKIKTNLLLCSHWLYCQMPSAMQQKKLLAKKLCDFTLWNEEKTSNVLAKIQFDTKNNFGWYHLVEVMYEYQIEQTQTKFINANKQKSKCETKNKSDLSFDELYLHMFTQWDAFDKKQGKLKDDASGIQMSNNSSNNTVYDTSDRIYQDFINNRWKFYSHSTLFTYREIGNYQPIKKTTFNKLSEIIESNLSSLYARDSVLSFLDEYICYDENLKGLLPSINFHQAFDNISDNENLVKFLELVFEEEKFARIHALEKALKTGIENELQSFETKIFLSKEENVLQQNSQCKIINALMNTVLSRLLNYFDAIYNYNEIEKRKKSQSSFIIAKDSNEQKEEDTNNANVRSDTNRANQPIFDFEKGENINIEFALWIISIFVVILTESKPSSKLRLYKMLLLIFNDTLMSLLFDCIVIAPPRIGVKVALMVSQIIEMYPKQNPFLTLKHNLFETAKLCNDLCLDKRSHQTQNENIEIEDIELYVIVKHVSVIANVLQDMHQNSQVPTDVIVALTQLMLSLTSCNYQHEYATDLHSMSWYQSVYSTYSALKWFAIKDKKERLTETLQFLSPNFYSKLYEMVSSWHQIKESEQELPVRNINFINVLQNNIDGYSNLLHKFKRLLILPHDMLCTEDTLTDFKNNLMVFCEISITLGVDKLPAIKDIINMHSKINIIKESQDWLILSQIKQICNKLAIAFNSLYYTIFANETNIIDKNIQMLGPLLDSDVTLLIEKKTRNEFDNIKDASNNNLSFEFSKETLPLIEDDLRTEEEDKEQLCLKVRQQSIYDLNQLFLKNIQHFDISNNERSIISLNKHLILNVVSCHILDIALEQSQDGQANEPSFQVDRFRCKLNGEPDYLMFSECMKQLHSFKPETFRLEAYSKAWKCQFANEHATDAGGPYRESIEWMMNEVQNNKYLNLCMLCPNGINNHGLNRDKYVPSPNQCSYEHEKMYIFLGKLMGLAMRTKELLPLNIAPIIWKKICQKNITITDILSIDKSAFSIFEHLDPFIKVLDIYSNEIHNYDDNIDENEEMTFIENEEIDEMIAQIQIFNSLMVTIRSKFQGKSSDGNTYPLIPNGELIPITHKNVKHYKTAFINFRIHEYDFACDAIRRGLSTVVPINILNILSWNKIEELICGQSVIDVKLFQQMTNYSNCSMHDKTIQIFWDVVKHKMNNVERSKLLQFVWGRSRLPLNKNDFDKKMSVLLLDQNNPNDYLPVSHTCFFQLDLPRYTDSNIMYEKLLYAITHCGSIDTDE